MRWLVALCLLVSASCEARPYTIDDLLAQESYGQVMLVPRAGLVLVERRNRYDRATDYSYGYQVRRLLSKVLATDLRSPGRLMPLFDQADDAGYWMGTPSPSEHRLSVFRLRDRALSLGVVDLDTRHVQWFAVAPDLPLAAPSPIWIDEDHIVMSIIDDGSLPFLLSLGNADQIELENLWSRAASGHESSSTFVATKSAEPDRATRSLVEVDLRSGTVRPLYRGDIVDLDLSPDRHRLAVVSAGTFRRPPAAPIDTSFIGRLHSVTMLDLSSGHSFRAAGDFLPGFMKWAPDGERLLAFRARDTFPNGEFVMINASGATIPLAPGLTAQITHDQSGTIVYAGWVGSTIVAAMQSGAAAWMQIDGRPRLLNIPGSARLVGSSSSGMWFRVGDRLLRVDGHGRRTTIAKGVTDVGATSLDPYSLGYRTIFDPDPPTSVTIHDQGGNHLKILGSGATLKLEHDGRSFVLDIANDAAITLDVDEHGVGTLLLRKADRNTRLDTINANLADINLPRAQALRDSHAPGDHADWLFLPSTRGPAPLIVIPYPGATYGPQISPASDLSAGSVPTNVNLLLASGYAVLLPSVPAAPAGAPASGLTRAVEAAIDRALATGRVDPTRIGLLGHSFGAYAVMTIASESRRFRGAVASSGPYDLLTAHGMMTGADRIRLSRGLPFDVSAGWVEGGQARMEALPIDAATAYLANSPIARADRIATPVLLVHGDSDAAGIEQAEHMFMELARHGADASLLRYWGEGHVLASPANIRDYWRRVIAFFDAHLGVTPPTRAPMPRSSPASSAPDNRGYRTRPRG